MDKSYEPIPVEIPDPFGEAGFVSLSDFGAVAINLVAGLGFVLSLFALSLGVVEIVISQGDKYKVKKGQNRLLYGIYGMLISFLIVVARTVLPKLLGSEFSIVGLTPD